MSDNTTTYVVYEYDNHDDKDIIYVGQDIEEAFETFNAWYFSTCPHQIHRGIQTWINESKVNEQFTTVEIRRSHVL